LLDGILQKNRGQFPGLTDDEFFEAYSADNILLSHDLSVEEIRDGVVDGTRDGGVDCAYLFINRCLHTEDLDVSKFKQPVDIEFYIIQAKNQDTFKENPVDKLSASLPALLDPNQTRAKLLEAYDDDVVNACRAFVEVRSLLTGEFPNVSVKIFYTCRGEKPSATPLAKATTLEGVLKAICQTQQVEFSFVGAEELYNRSSVQKRLVKNLSVIGTPLSGTNSFAAFTTLADYINFISDDDGSILSRIFDANVRDYQGEVDVNKEIRASLQSPTAGVDFWWLNNGVTIVADDAQFTSNKLVVQNPLVVNGLQTSHELHKFRAGLAADDKRMVLVRVIVENDRVKRDEIIKATNRQTKIQLTSFWATQPVHRRIEDYLLTINFYYDRRKNLYKREGKPADRILSIDRLAQGVLALLLSQPHTARARPTTAIKDETTYGKIFSTSAETHPLEMYGAVANLLHAVDRYFKAIAADTNQIERNNLRFHTLMVLGWAVCGTKEPNAQTIAHMDLARLTDAALGAASTWVFEKFRAAGGTDKIAKEEAFTNTLIADWPPATSVAGPAA
jgi:hypothetical protein